MLLAECIEHDFKWMPVLMDELFSQNRLSATKSGAMKLAAWYMQRRLKPAMELTKAGKNPIRHGSSIGRGDFPSGGWPEKAEA